MQAYKLGVIGGMGSLATSLFFSKIIEKTKASKDQEHINTIILNHASMPDRTDAIVNHTESEFLKNIKQDIRLLEIAGVANIAIPCNTTHYFYKDLLQMTDINIINMVNSTVKHIANNFAVNSKIAVLGTNGTIQSGVYEKELKSFELENYQLDEKTQEEIMDIIYKIKSNNNFYPENLSQIITDLVQDDCVCVILACTELSTVKLEESVEKLTIDALDILVNESIILSGKESMYNI